MNFFGFAVFSQGSFKTFGEEFRKIFLRDWPKKTERAKVARGNLVNMEEEI